MKTSGKMVPGLFAAAVLCALGFGATQTLAETPASGTTARTCEAFQCHKGCVLDGYDWGECVDGVCECWYQ